MSLTANEVQERTQTYRDLVGMAALVAGRGDSGFHEFDEWLTAVSHPTEGDDRG